jgi:hypothetical protein
MNMQEYRNTQAERAALEKLIEQLPPSSVIERMSLEARKKEVEDAIASQPSSFRDPARAKLTFRGKPIVGSHGIFATFGATAVNTFAEAVAAIAASQDRPLGARGALPNRDDYQLLITGTALGSFGFELEEAPGKEMLFSEIPSTVESAIEQTKSILESTKGTDDELTDAVSETDPRALETLRTFLKTLEDQEAVCTLEFKNRVFQFADVGEVRQSNERLSQDNIHEDQQQIEGVFQGVLPKRRMFEFKIMPSQEVIVGKVRSDIPDISAINHILDQFTTIEVMVTRVGGGSPRYVLLSYAEPQPTD